MIRLGIAAICAVLVSLSVPAEACGWKRDGLGWRSAEVGTGYGWRHRRHWRGDGYGYRSGVAVGVRTDRWDRDRRSRGDGYGWRATAWNAARSSVIGAWMLTS